jgi:hypothetical protein
MKNTHNRNAGPADSDDRDDSIQSPATDELKATSNSAPNSAPKHASANPSQAGGKPAESDRARPAATHSKSTPSHGGQR